MIVGDGYVTRPAWRDTAPFGELIVDQVDAASMVPQLESFWRLFGEQRPKGRAI